MSIHFPRESVVSLVSTAINDRLVLAGKYEAKRETRVVEFRIAPFDIGSSDTKRAEQSKDMLFAYSYDSVDSKTLLPNPGLRSYSLFQFLLMEETDEVFDENELAELMKTPTFDYRLYVFAHMPERNWFKKTA